MSGRVQRAQRKVEWRSCKRCDHRFDTRHMRCPSCGQWDVPGDSRAADETELLSEISDTPIDYIAPTGPWDKCFSAKGGIPTVAVVLIAGAPGAGKSTMALQLTDRIADVTKREILYISAEEDKGQVKDRAQRLQVRNMNRVRVYPMGANTDLRDVIMTWKPCAVVVDSLPGLTPDLDQAVELCKRFKEFSIQLQMPVLIVDHVNKQEDFAGLMALQHEVDTTMQFTVLDEVRRDLSTIKNRFGPCVSVTLDMTERGLILGLDDDEDEDD